MINTEIYTLERINKWGENTMMEHLGIVVTEIGPDYIVATMPVDNRTVQPRPVECFRHCSWHPCQLQYQ